MWPLFLTTNALTALTAAAAAPLAHPRRQLVSGRGQHCLGNQAPDEGRMGGVGWMDGAGGKGGEPGRRKKARWRIRLNLKKRVVGNNCFLPHHVIQQG